MSDSWICNACTFENENVSADTCDMCSTRRQNVGNKNTTTKEPRQHTLFGKLSEEIDLTSSKPSRKRKKPPQAPSAAPLQSFFVPCADTQATIFPPYTLSPSHKFSCHDIHSVLKAVFKLDSLRQNLQTQAIETALRQQSQLLVLATGGGKSLCYQLPACLLGGVTIVISPLIALMQDQIQGLSERGVPAACISSQQTDKENQVVLHRVLDSKERPLTILYITPESIQTDRMRQVLVELNKQKRLTMFAVDEAHCLSSWGHDFRPAYRKLTWLRTQFTNTPCMACTATATPQVIEDIQSILHLKNAPLLKGSFDRPNIFYKVKYKHDGTLDEMIKWIVQQHSKSAIRNEKCSGIVYVHKREETSQIARRISQQKIRAEPYHAGLKKNDRNRVQEEWSRDQVQVAVATVAFGMGIDLAHVRYVIHWSIPKTIEGFYQESGRAGRDGLPSHSILYYSPDDVSKFQYLIRMQSDETQSERKLEGFEKMVRYCTSPACRRNTLIQHFGGTPVQCQRTCDFCRNPEKVKRTIQSAAIVQDVLGHKYKSSHPYQAGQEQWNSQLEHDEDAIAQDWGDGMVGDLRVTDTRSSWEESASLDEVKRSGGGFVKASSILLKYEKLEEKVGTIKGKKAGNCERLPSSVPIPDHFRAIPVVSKKPTTKTELTSQDHARKAEQLRREMEQLDAERETRLKALLEKRRKA